MSDLISREQAIDRINKQREHLQPDVYAQDAIGDAAYRICAEFIERLPSAERVGKWRRVGARVDLVECTSCGYRLDVEPYTDPSTNECPNCGARMVSEE